MVSRSDTSKTIRRRTGGAGKKTGKGTSLKKINIDKYRWEDDPDFKGTAGPYNPRSKKMKKKKYDYEVYQDLGPMGPTGTISYGADWPVAKRKLIKEGKIKGPLSKREQKIVDEKDRRRKTGEDRATVVTDEDRKKYREKAKRAEAFSHSRKTGGTVKKKYSHGGKIKTKKTYGGHHGSKLVAKLYD